MAAHLTLEQTQGLAWIRENGRTEAHRTRARNLLVTRNIGLVKANVLSLPNSEDLEQEGMIALMRAADSYNWRRPFRFSTYAVLCIKREIGRANAKLRWRQMLSLQNDHLFLTEDRYYGKDVFEERARDFLPEAIQSLSANERQVIRARFISGRRSTLDDVARSMGLCKQRIQQIETRAIKKLRAIFSD